MKIQIIDRFYYFQSDRLLRVPRFLIEASLSIKEWRLVVLSCELLPAQYVERSRLSFLKRDTFFSFFICRRCLPASLLSSKKSSLMSQWNPNGCDHSTLAFDVLARCSYTLYKASSTKMSYWLFKQLKRKYITSYDFIINEEDLATTFSKIVEFFTDAFATLRTSHSTNSLPTAFKSPQWYLRAL